MLRSKIDSLVRGLSAGLAVTLALSLLILLQQAVRLMSVSVYIIMPVAGVALFGLQLGVIQTRG